MENLTENNQISVTEEQANVYIAPRIRIEEVIVEQGFAASSPTSPFRGGDSPGSW